MSMKMRKVFRESVSNSFLVEEDVLLPEIPKGGARIAVHYAGACFEETQLKSHTKNSRLYGFQDTSIFPGFEICGIVHALCPTLVDCHVGVGDYVIIYPDEKETDCHQGFADFVNVLDVKNLLKIPTGMCRKKAAMLPTGALTAFRSIDRVRPLILEKLNKFTDRKIYIGIVGSEPIAMWTIILVKHLFASKEKFVHIVAAVRDASRLKILKKCGANEVIHWDEKVYEEYLIERTFNACKEGVDVIFDLYGSTRNTKRELSCLGPEGVLVTGGYLKYAEAINLNHPTKSNQIILGVSKGSREKIQELIEKVHSGEIMIPPFETYPVEKANKVFRQISQSSNSGRALLRFKSIEEDVDGDMFDG